MAKTHLIRVEVQHYINPSILYLQFVFINLKLSGKQNQLLLLLFYLYNLLVHILYITCSYSVTRGHNVLLQKTDFYSYFFIMFMFPTGLTQIRFDMIGLSGQQGSDFVQFLGC